MNAHPLLRLAAFAVLALLTLLALLLSAVAFQGRREWARTKADLLARGEKLSLVELAPPPVPDHRNFFADPLWSEPSEKESPPADRPPRLWQALRAPLGAELQARARTLSRALGPGHELAFGDRLVLGEVISSLRRLACDPAGRPLAQFTLEALRPLDEVLARIRDLARRPDARLELDCAKGLFTPLPHLGNVISLGHALHARALAQLHLGEAAAAGADVLLVLRLADALQTEPFSISLSLRLQLLKIAGDLVALGLRAHQWTEPQLAGFAAALARIDLLPQLALSLRGERGALNQYLEQSSSSLSRSYETASVHPRPYDLWWDTFPIVDRLAFEMGSRLFNSSDQSQVNRATQAGLDALALASKRGLVPGDFPPPCAVRSPSGAVTEAGSTPWSGSSPPPPSSCPSASPRTRSRRPASPARSSVIASGKAPARRPSTRSHPIFSPSSRPTSWPRRTSATAGKRPAASPCGPRVGTRPTRAAPRPSPQTGAGSPIRGTGPGRCRPRPFGNNLPAVRQ